MELAEIRDLLQRARTIAVVGCSPRPERDSHRVASYLQREGYRIIPVNPGHDRILGERCYASLDAVPVDVWIDVVNIFRRSQHVPEVVEAAIRRGLRTVWLQLGCSNSAAQARAAAHGMRVVAERCIMVDHARLLQR